MNIRSVLQHGLGLAAMGTRRVVGVHLGPDMGLMTQAVHQPSGILVVEKCVSIPWLGKSTAEQAQLLRAQWMEREMTGTSVICTFPHGQAIVRSLILPATEPRELQEMVRLQAYRQLPLSAEEIEVHGHRLGEPSEGYSRVLMIAVRKEDVHHHLERLHQAGFSPDKLVLDSLVSLPLIRGHDRAEESVLVLDLGPRRVTLGLFQGTVLHSLRSFSLPAEPMPWIPIFKEEVDKTILQFYGRPSPPLPLHVYLAGEQEKRQVASELLQKERAFHIHQVRPSQRMAFARKLQEEESVSWWAALGASLTPAFSTPNLLPEEELRRKNRRRRRMELRTTAFLSLVLVILGVGGLLQRFYSGKEYLSRLSQQAKEIAARAGELRRMQLQTQRIQNPMAPKGSFLHLLSDLTKAVPGRISIQTIVFERDRALQIQGTSFSLAETLRFVGELQKNRLFSKAELASSNRRRLHEQEVIDFQLACPLGFSVPHRKQETDR